MATRTMRGSLAVVLLVACDVAMGRPAHAQTASDPAAADALFNRGKELIAAGDWGQACAKFQASMELDPSVGALLKIGKCCEHDGKLALALHDYRAVLVLNRQKAGQTERRRADVERFTEDLILRLEPRVPKIRVVLDERPAGLRVTRGGEELPVAALGEPLPVNPGSVEVVAEAPGFRTERRTMVLGEGETRDVVIALQRSPVTVPVSGPLHEQSPFAQGRDEASTSSGLAPASRQGSGPRPWSARKTVAVVVGGTGVLALGLSGAMALEERGNLVDASPYCTPAYQCRQQGVDFLGQASRD